MNEDLLGKFFESLTSTWETALNERRPQDVVFGGILAYLFFQDAADQNRKMASLVYLREAIDDLLGDVAGRKNPIATKPGCSFCGQGEPEVRLAAGANGFICDSCVRNLGEVFKQ